MGAEAKHGIGKGRGGELMCAKKKHTKKPNILTSNKFLNLYIMLPEVHGKSTQV